MGGLIEVLCLGLGSSVRWRCAADQQLLIAGGTAEFPILPVLPLKHSHRQPVGNRIGGHQNNRVGQSTLGDFPIARWGNLCGLCGAREVELSNDCPMEAHWTK